jgi:hypothetical protein
MIFSLSQRFLCCEAVLRHISPMSMSIVDIHCHRIFVIARKSYSFQCISTAIFCNLYIKLKIKSQTSKKLHRKESQACIHIEIINTNPNLKKELFNVSRDFRKCRSNSLKCFGHLNKYKII